MKVTKVQLSFPYKSNTYFKCWAKIVLDDLLMVTGIRLFERKIGDNVERTILFPDKQPSLYQTGGEYVSIAVVNTTDQDLRNHIRDAVFAAYDTHPKNPKNMKREVSPTTNTNYNTTPVTPQPSSV